MSEAPSTEPPPILCVWCSAPWSDENLSVYIGEVSSGCDSCGYGATATVDITIRCHACGALMYEKNGIETDL